MTDVQIIFPATDEGALTTFLRGITRVIAEREGVEAGYGLGGSDGYGCEWDSDVFMMHPYCWCERSDCAWCAGCDCPEPCSYHSDDAHQNVGFVADKGAPNFWHKPSGLKVWWYKYIGRGMDVQGQGDLLQIAKECAADVAAQGMETRQGGNVVPSRSDDSPVREDAPDA